MRTELLLDVGNSRFYSKQDMTAYQLNADIIVQNALIEGDGKSFPLQGLIEGSDNARLVFQEITFNPVTRVKRGKFYEVETSNGQQAWYCNAFDTKTLSRKDNGHTVYVNIFRPYRPSRNNDLKKTFIYFGTKELKSKWKILSVDYDMANEEILVIQEINGLGTIPSLDETKIDPRYYAEISQHYSRLFNEINSAPETVIDICRAVATSLLSAKLALVDSDRDDLGVILRKLTEVKDATDGATQKKYFIARSCAEIINRLHPRGKPNEVVKHDLRMPLFADADFAVQALFQIIREFEFDN